MPMSLRSLAHIGVSAVVLSASTTDSLFVSQSLARCELSLLTLNLATFSLHTTTRSMVCASTFLLAFICARSDTLPSVRSFAKLGSSLFAFGSPLLVRAASPGHADPPLASRSFACSRFESLGSQEESEVAALLNCESTSYAYSYEFGVPCDGSQGPLQLDSSHRLHLLQWSKGGLQRWILRDGLS